MEKLGDVFKRTMKSLSFQNPSLEEPKPTVCMYCGSKLHYRPLMHPFDKSRVFMWLTPDLCGCPKATEQHERTLKQLQEERVRQEQMEAEQRRIKTIETLFKSSQMPARFRQRTFENFKVTPANEKAYVTALNYAENFRFVGAGGPGLLFSGPVGTGKTHLAAAIAQHLLNNCNSVIFGTVTTLLGWVKETYKANSDKDERDIIKQFFNVSLLVVDDLGKEKATEWVEQMLYEVINARYENCMPVVVTTNKTLRDIRDIYPKNGEAIESRLIEMCQGVKMDGDDYRKSRLT